MQTPRTSVLIPAHRAERTVRQAVESALGQTVGDLEVIVVDDGSEVPAAEALRGIVDRRLRLIVHGRNRGAPAARNTGLRAARAPFVSLLDADDLWEPEYVESVLPAFDDPAIGLAYANTAIVGHPDGRSSYIDAPEQHPVDEFRRLVQRDPIPTLTVTMRRDAVLAVGGFAEWLRMCDDYHLLLKLSLAGWRFAYVHRTLARYRWPEPDRGQTFDRTAHQRDEMKMWIGLAIRHPLTNGPRGRAYDHLKLALKGERYS